MTTRRRQIRSQRPSPLAPIIKKAADKAVSIAKPIARTIKFAGEKAISGYLGATNKLAKKVSAALPAQKRTTSLRSRRQVK